jgi:hypothetical protein
MAQICQMIINEEHITGCELKKCSNLPFTIFEIDKAFGEIMSAYIFSQTHPFHRIVYSFPWNGGRR